MRLWRAVGVSAVALGLFVGASGAALAGADSPGAVPVVGKDGGVAPAAVVPVSTGISNAPAAVGASKDAAGVAPAGQAPARVAAAPGHAGGLDPAALGALLGGAGLLSLGGGLVWQRKRS